MKQKLGILFFVIAVSCTLYGQEINNLVPNGGFEDVDSCFKQLRSLWRLSSWNAAIDNSYCSSDYYNKCQLNFNWHPRMPINNTIGQASAAIILKSTTTNNYREYLQCKLDSTLELNTSYIVELTIRPTYLAYQTEWGVQRIEVLFSEANISSPDGLPQRIDTMPSVGFNGQYLDTNVWYKCKTAYIGIGVENFITIGMFSPDSTYGFFPIGDTLRSEWKTAYYLIDNVKVYKASDTIKRPELEPDLPNVFTPNHDGVNDVYTIENLPQQATLKVFNRWGNVVFMQQPYRNNWQGQSPNGQPLPDGVYFAILAYRTEQGELKQVKQTVHLLR